MNGVFSVKLFTEYDMTEEEFTDMLDKLIGQCHVSHYEVGD